MTIPPVRTAGAKIWTCDDCGVRFSWTERSYWYSSLREMEDGDWERISVYCGCRPMPKEAKPL